MKARILAIIVVLAVLVSSITACKPKANYLIQVMKLAPENAEGVNCADIKGMAEDSEFELMYDYMISSMSYEAAFVEAADVSVFGSFEIDWEIIYVLIGDFHIGDVCDALTEDDYVKGEYRGIEIWTDDFENTVAFLDNMIVYGYKDAVEACICIHKNEEPSMYDNEDMKAVADKLPAAISYVVVGPDVMYNIEALSGGICWRNSTIGDGVLDMSGWLKFDSVASAAAAMEDVEDDWSSEPYYTNIETRLSGQFIEITGEMEIPED